MPITLRNMRFYLLKLTDGRHIIGRYYEEMMAFDKLEPGFESWGACYNVPCVAEFVREVSGGEHTQTIEQSETTGRVFVLRKV